MSAHVSTRGSPPVGAPTRVSVRGIAAKSLDFIALQGREGACLPDLWKVLELRPQDAPLQQVLWRIWTRHQEVRDDLDDVTTATATNATGSASSSSCAVPFTLRLEIRSTRDDQQQQPQHQAQEQVPTDTTRKRKSKEQAAASQETSAKKRKTNAKTNKATVQADATPMASNPVLLDEFFAQESWRNCALDEFHARIQRLKLDLDQVFLVACDDLRHRAMNIAPKAVMADLSVEHLQILELIGKARHHGTTVPELSQQLTQVPIKKLHTLIDTLLSYKLMTKRMIVVVKPVMKRMNILHLPRFAKHFDPKMYAKSATFETDDQERRLLLATAEMYLLKQPGRVTVMSDLGRDLGLDRRKLETLRNVVLQEGKRDENFPFELFQAVLERTEKQLEPRILNCIRYVGAAGGSKGDNDTDADSSSDKGVLHELGLVRQVFQSIERTGSVGSTVMNIREDIGIPGNKLPYRLVTLLAKTYGLKGEMELQGKNKVFRLFVPDRLRLDAPSSSATPEAAAGISSSHKRESPPTLMPAVPVPVPSASETSEANSSSIDPLPLAPPSPSWAPHNYNLSKALDNDALDVTLMKRREHILQRLRNEKIISLYSLRASIFAMERREPGVSPFASSAKHQHHHNNNNSTSSDSADTVSSCIISGIDASKSFTGGFAVGIIDVRSLQRIIDLLEKERKASFMELPFPGQNVSTKLRKLRCVVLAGHEHDEVLMQHFVMNYGRQERLRRVYHNVGSQTGVRIREVSDDDDDDNDTEEEQEENQQEEAKNRQETLATTTASDRPGSKANQLLALPRKKRRIRPSKPSQDIVSESMLYMAKDLIHSTKLVDLPAIDYRVNVGTWAANQLHYQYTALGFAYGVMYRCREFHRFLWKYHLEQLKLQQEQLQQQQEQDLTASSSCRVTGEGKAKLKSTPTRAAAALQEDTGTSLVYARESVLHAMPVSQYIRVFSGGSVLTREEMIHVRKIMADDPNTGFDALPSHTFAKIVSQEGKRAARVLGNLHDLGLLHPHTMRMHDLIRLVQQEFQDDSAPYGNGTHQSGFLANAIRENAFEGLFKICTKARIQFDASPIQTLYATGELASQPPPTTLSGDTEPSRLVSPSTTTLAAAPLSSSQVNRAPMRRLSKEEVAIRRFLNQQKHVKIAGTTMKSYSFGLQLPLEFDFEKDPNQLDLYWEVLECLCLEKELVMEIPSELIQQIPKYQGPLVCELPKPKRTRVRQQFKHMGWILKTHRIKKVTATMATTKANPKHIVSKPGIRRSSRKRKRPDDADEQLDTTHPTTTDAPVCEPTTTTTTTDCTTNSSKIITITRTINNNHQQIAQADYSLVLPNRRRLKKQHAYKRTLRQQEETLNPFAWSPQDQAKLIDLFLDELASKWQQVVPCELRSDFHDETRAYIGGNLATTQGFAVALLAKKLKKRHIDVRKRLAANFEEPQVKHRIRQCALRLQHEYQSEHNWSASKILSAAATLTRTAKTASQELPLALELTLSHETTANPMEQRGYRSILHDEEQVIIHSTRLSALFRRAVMMIMSPEEIYHPFVAEEMISYWTSEEIKLVWRYLWMRRWIIKAKVQEQRIRGFVKSNRLRELLKVTRVLFGYPLYLFVQTAQQQSFVMENLLEQDYEQGDDDLEDDKESATAVYTIEFPANASRGYCAFQLAAQAMEECDFRVTYQVDGSTSSKNKAKRVAALATEAQSPKKMKRTRAMVLQEKERPRQRLRGRGRPSVAGHGVVAQIVSVSQADDLEKLMDCWQVKTYNHLCKHQARDRHGAINEMHSKHFQAFSAVSRAWNCAPESVCHSSTTTTTRAGRKIAGLTPALLEQKVVQLVQESGSEGLSELRLLDRLHQSLLAKKNYNREVVAAEAMRLLQQLLAKEDAPLLRVPCYTGSRLVSRQFEHFWFLRRFTLEKLPRGHPQHEHPHELQAEDHHHHHQSQTHFLEDADPAKTTTASRSVLQFESSQAKVFSFPWLCMDGQVNHDFLFALQRRVIELLIDFPGMSDVAVYRGLEKLLSLQDTRELLRLLIENKVIYARAMANDPLANLRNGGGSGLDFFFGQSVNMQPASTTTGSRIGTRLFTPNVELLRHGSSQLYPRPVCSVVLHYFPHVDCIQRFGNLVEDAQNEN